LVATFDRPLDHALLGDCLHVLGPDGRPLPGTATVGPEERSWRWEPSAPWVTGPHHLVVDSVLEDVAGNSVRRVFDRDLGRPEEIGDPLNLLWVTDFPLFEAIGDDGRPVPAHHPFTQCHPDDEAILESDPLACRSRAYDLVLNGVELGSGSVRIHRRDLQQRIFSLLGIDEELAQERFGFLLDAFRYGVPPHAGFAFGIDRLAMILAGEHSLREVIAFPKTQSGGDPLTDAPAAVDTDQLTALGLARRPVPK